MWGEKGKEGGGGRKRKGGRKQVIVTDFRVKSSKGFLINSEPELACLSFSILPSPADLSKGPHLGLGTE